MEQVQKIVIVMPTYNEAENIEPMAEALFGLGIEQLHWLVVDDNSPDGTADLAESLNEQYSNRIHVLRREKKAGLGPAYLAGFVHALNELGADVLFQMDADFSHQPKYIPIMLEALQNADTVIGSRYTKGGGVDESWGFFRKFVSGFANKIYVRTILRIPVNDATGGFRAWKKETLIGMDIERIRANGYVFQVELTYLCHKSEYKFVEIPIYFPDRVRGTSKLDSSIAIEAALRTWQILFRHHNINASQRRTKPYTTA